MAKSLFHGAGAKILLEGFEVIGTVGTIWTYGKQDGIFAEGAAEKGARFMKRRRRSSHLQDRRPYGQHGGLRGTAEDEESKSTTSLTFSTRSKERGGHEGSHQGLQASWARSIQQNQSRGPTSEALRSSEASF